MDRYIKILLIFVIFIILYLVDNKIIESYSNLDKEEVYEYKNFLTNEECDMLINIAKNKLEESRVYSINNNKIDKKHRDSQQCWIKDDESAISKKISDFVSKLVDFPIENNEMLQIVKYNKGGFFNPHYDPLCVGKKEECLKINGESGPRYCTFIIYLNDDFEGGETCFIKKNKCLKPEKGKAVLFFNTDDNENLLVNSEHAGKPVTKGEKWICNKWVHFRKYTP